MRAFRLVVCLLMCLFGSGVIACGGGGGGGDPKEVAGDAQPLPPDAPADAAVTCAQRGTLNVSNPLDYSTAGQLSGEVPNNGTELTAGLVVFTNAAETTAMVIVQRNNAGVFSAATGEAGRFEKPPATGLYALDTAMSSGFLIEFFDGFGKNPDGSTSFLPTQVALLDPFAGGSVRIDTWTPAAVPGGTSRIGATFSNARFRGFNLLANGDLDLAGNGCDILLQNLQFKNLSVKWQTAPFPANITASPPLSFDVAPRIPPLSRDVAPWILDSAAVFRQEIAFER